MIPGLLTNSKFVLELTSLIVLSCPPVRVVFVTHFPFAPPSIPQSLIVLSSPQEANKLPFGCHLQLQTRPRWPVNTCLHSKRPIWERESKNISWSWQRVTSLVLNFTTQTTIKNCLFLVPVQTVNTRKMQLKMKDLWFKRFIIRNRGSTVHSCNRVKFA